MFLLNNLKVCFILVLITLCATAEGSQRKKLVLIHYANETSPQGKDGFNYESTIQRLEKLKNESAHQIAASLKRDPKLFAEALKRDRPAFRRLVTHNNLDLVYCEVDNRSARKGEFRCWLPGKNSPQTKKMKIVKSRSYIFDSNPLATPEGLDQSLKSISDLFPPSQHKYALVTLSHGSKSMAMSVKLARRTDLLCAKEFQDLVEGNSSEVALPDSGTTKSEYLEVISKAGSKYGMSFELVVLESCQGSFDKTLLHNLPDNVKLFYASGHQNLEFSSIPYVKLFANISNAEDVIAALDSHLSDKFLRVTRKSVGQSWTNFMWFLPIVVLFLRQRFF